MKINSLWQRLRSRKQDENEILPPAQEEGQLHRNLKERHMTMIALGGTIGTGLFLASGQALASSGPAGVLVSYVIVSIMVYFVMTSLGRFVADNYNFSIDCLSFQ